MSEKKQLLSAVLVLTSQVHQENSQYQEQFRQLENSHRRSVQKILKTIAGIRSKIESLPDS